MDKFVGSSEMKLREIFDNPPDIFDFVRNQEPDHGEAIAQTVRLRLEVHWVPWIKNISDKSFSFIPCWFGRCRHFMSLVCKVP
jgi:hypothetical protein